MPVTQTTEMPATTTRLTGIDGVRGVAIFMVIAGHLIGFAGLHGRSEVYSELFKTPLHVLWDERAAVQIFFVLSGFVLQRGVHQQMSSTLAYRFLITRFFRLYPLYAIALAFALGCRALWAGHGQLTAFNPELGIFWDRPVGVGEAIAEIIPIFPVNQISNINAVIWSIFVEFKFSLVFPIIALSVAYTEDKTVSFWLLLIGTFWYSWTSPLGSAGRYLFHFVLGAALAKTAPRWSAAGRRRWNVAGAVLSIWLFELRYTSYAPNLEQGHFDLLCAVGGGMLLCCVVRSSTLHRFFSMPALVWLGRRTYGIYLFHFPILLVVVSWASRCFSSDQLLVWIVAAVTTVLFGCVLGTLGYRWIEIPGNALGKRLAAAVTVGSATL